MAKRIANPYSLKAIYSQITMLATITLCLNKEPIKEITFDGSELPDDARHFVSSYGIGKILMDRNSDFDTEEKLTAMEETWKMLLTGKLKKDRVVGSFIVSVKVEAIARVQGCSIPEAQRSYSKYSDADKEVIDNHPKVLEMMKVITEERDDEDSSPSLDDLLTG